jgi:predicted membrane GTPase involved in stress response
VSHVFCMHGTEKIPMQSAQAGDIVMLAGVTNAGVSDTVRAESARVACGERGTANDSVFTRSLSRCANKA